MNLSEPHQGKPSNRPGAWFTRLPHRVSVGWKHVIKKSKSRKSHVFSVWSNKSLATALQNERAGLSQQPSLSLAVSVQGLVSPAETTLGAASLSLSPCSWHFVKLVTVKAKTSVILTFLKNAANLLPRHPEELPCQCIPSRPCPAAECPSPPTRAHAARRREKAATSTGTRAVFFTFPFCWSLRRVKDEQFFIHLLAVWVSSFVNYAMAKHVSFIFFLSKVLFWFQNHRVHATEVQTVKERVARLAHLTYVNDNPGKSPLLAVGTLCFQNFKENFECCPLALKSSLSFYKVFLLSGVFIG